MLPRGDPVPLELLVRSNLVQQELTRLGISSIALLNKTVNVTPDVMLKLCNLLDREVERYDHELTETVQRLTVTERTERKAHLETRHCPGSHALSGPGRTTGPGVKFNATKGQDFVR